MRYLFSTGLLAALGAGISMLRGSRGEPLTWRASLAWLSWGITLALAIGAAIDLNRDERGVLVAADSPVANKQRKQAEKESKRAAKAVKKNRKK